MRIWGNDVDMKKLAILVLSVLAALAVALPAAGFIPDVRSLSVDPGTIKGVAQLDGSVLRAQQVRDTTGAAGISRQEVTGEETPVPMNYNPYWWGRWGWGGPGWNGWGWPLWNSWGGWW